MWLKGPGNRQSGAWFPILSATNKLCVSQGKQVHFSGSQCPQKGQRGVGLDPAKPLGFTVHCHTDTSLAPCHSFQCHLFHQPMPWWPFLHGLQPVCLGCTKGLSSLGLFWHLRFPGYKTTSTERHLSWGHPRLLGYVSLLSQRWVLRPTW